MFHLLVEITDFQLRENLFGFLFIIYAILRKPAYTPLEEENEGVGEKKDEMSGADATINKD